MARHSVRLGSPSGEGATSRVWRAVVEGEPVALKIGRSRDLAEAFADEAFYASLALSPGVPDLLDAGSAQLTKSADGWRAELRPGDPLTGESVPYLAFRWIAGRLLFDALEHTTPLAIARAVSATLADMHDAGVAHGDVKPDNLLVDDDGLVHLLDLGMCVPEASRALDRATPRFLALGDEDMGNARSRDLLALGLVLAELLRSELRTEDDLVNATRREPFEGVLGHVISALLTNVPAARPSARWVHDLCSAALGPSSATDDQAKSRWQRSVRACYLRLRMPELARGVSTSGEVAEWLPGVVELVKRSRVLRTKSAGTETEKPAVMEPLDQLGRRRWLTALAGRGAVGWSPRVVGQLTELELSRALVSLAEKKRPSTWVLSDVEAAVGGDLELGEPDLDSIGPRTPLSVERAASLGLRLAKLPPDPVAIETIERLIDTAPANLIVAAADALRLSGEWGRARHLVDIAGAGAEIAADILRRAGQLDEAVSVAQGIVDADRDANDRAIACIARIALDRGNLDEAEALVGGRATSAALEVASLVAAARGDRLKAIRLAEHGVAVADGAEWSARLSAVLAYASTPSADAPDASDARAARDGYRAAAGHAQRVGATLEEASYLQGEAAASVALGELDDAVDAAYRAALLWGEVLGLPERAGPAWLASAAAFAAVGAGREAVSAAERALDCAVDAANERAELYAWWVIADAVEPGSEQGVTAATTAAQITSGDVDEDVHSAARLWRHQPSAIAPERREGLDDSASADGQLAVYTRMTWWWARAERILLDGNGDEEDGARVLVELQALAEDNAPLPTRVRAMHHGACLAAARADGASLARFEAARAVAARTIIEGTTRTLRDAARACPWLHAHPASDTTLMSRVQASDFERLVRALSERESLGALLDHVIDALLLWTRAERGLLLLPAANGELVPRSARALNREDLPLEQLALSKTLAQRALDSGEPLLAADAMSELPSNRYQSVHALKLRSILVVPLMARGQVQGVAYLDDRIHAGVFTERELALAQAIGPVAGLAIADARTQIELKRAVQRAEQATSKLEDALAHKDRALDAVHRELADRIGSDETRVRHLEIVGDSAAVRLMLRMIDRVAASDIPVLLRGESGTGKELVARAIHRNSDRASQPFVGENCGALADSLLESTLFGHERGAFTGAHRSRPGLFSAADGGTLFLDEVGEMSLPMQTRLLRVLEDGQVRPVGATQSHAVDVRILAATHRDLEAMVEAGRFREDLYYRLNVVPIEVPALRERRDDIVLLAQHFLDKHSDGEAPRLTQRAAAWLVAQPWPGNVRQLENEIRRAVLFCDDTIDLEHLGADADEPDVDTTLDVRTNIDRVESQLIRRALDQTEGNKTKAAELLGLSRYGLHKMMKRLGLDEDPAT